MTNESEFNDYRLEGKKYLMIHRLMFQRLLKVYFGHGYNSSQFAKQISSFSTISDVITIKNKNRQYTGGGGEGGET